MKSKVFLAVLILAIIAACEKIPTVSPIPKIHFKSLTAGLYPDTALGNSLLPSAKLVFSFIDGDADIGVYSQTAQDTTLPDSVTYNIFLIPYYKVDTTYYLVPLDTTLPPPDYRILDVPKLDRTGQNKTIKGDITITIVDLPVYDTIRYKFYIRDRAGHKSNVETTTDIGVKGLLNKGL